MALRLIKYHYLRFLRLPGDPRAIARGIAVGIFIGITPTIPLHTLLVLAFCLLFKASKVAGVLASMVVSNPFTVVFQYYLSWRVGNVIFPGLLSRERLQEIMAILSADSGFSTFQSSLLALSGLGFDAILVMVVGGILLALPFTAAGYSFSAKFFTRLRKNTKTST